jgi:nucleoside-diphosphate-sugar epimerase
LKQVIAITGASGFIGQSICQRLVSQNYSLRALIRSPGQQSLPALQGAEVIQGDLANLAGLQRLVEGAAAVIHCAGRVRGATQAQFDHVNVDGIRNLVRAIKTSSSVPRLLSFSSLAAREPGLSFYAASKHRAEQVLKEEAAGITWSVLRPPAVYGPGDRELLPLFRLMARGIALTPGSPTARFSMLYVEDLSSAAIAWLRGNPVSGKIYTLDDGQVDGYDWHDLSRIVGELCNRRVRVIRASSWLLDFPARINSVLATITGGLPMLTPEKLRELRHHDWVCNNAAFRRHIDWRPRFSLAAGLRATPNWPGHVPCASAPR